jgi:chromosome segregation ATPase
MSDVSELAGRVAARNVQALEQVCSMRASLATLLAQTLQTEATIRNRIAELEHEAQRLRTQLDQVTPAIETLKQKIHSVDEAIRKQGRVVHTAMAAQTGHAEVEREKRVEDSRQAGRPVRRKDG